MTPIQQLLDFAIPEPPSIVTLNGMVYDILRRSGDWWMPWELCNAIQNRYDLKISDSSCTARLRDLRKPRFGSHVIEKRRREGSTAYEYRMVQ
jgi:hypothetical protein